MKKKQLDKGAVAEELLKSYFTERGYYVQRGVNVTHENTLITDIDIFLYRRTSHFNIERINVDIKNKKVSKALERIFWTRGVKDILGFTNCMVATTDRRKVVKDFARIHKVKLLDGDFMGVLKKSETVQALCDERLSEEEFRKLLDRDGIDKMDGSWANRFDSMKSRLIGESSFVRLIKTLNDFEFFLVEYLSKKDEEKEVALRMVYLSLSIVCVLADSLSLNIIHEDEKSRLAYFKNGFTFGNDTLESFKTVFRWLEKRPFFKQNDLKLESYFEESLDEIPSSIISEYFARQNVLNGLFDLSRVFNSLSFMKITNSPTRLPVECQSMIYVYMDYYGIDRKLLE